jgi:Ca-activated chloride channel family protein
VLFDESVPVYPQNLEEAREFIESLEANGGTNMAPAMRQAMNLPKQPALMRQIVFVTDGSVGNERELLMKIGEQLGDSRLFTVSIGAAPNSWFMRKAAEIGRGSHTQIGQLIDVEARMGSLWARIENPAVQNLCVDWGTDAEYYPEIVPDLYAGEPLWLFARLPHAPGEVTLCGELDGQPWESSSRLLPAAAGESLVTLWARKKIESLEDSRMFGSDPDQVRQEVLDLALDHGLLTAYTSLVAVDKTPVRPAAAELERNDIPSLLPAGSAVSIGFSPTATGWPLRLALSALSLLIATGMLLYLPPSQARRSRCNRSPVATSIP